MSDLPQGYSHIELDKGFIELEGQTLAIKDYPELYRITFTVSRNYTKVNKF